jgi:high affinity sulfate transporter 1
MDADNDVDTVEHPNAPTTWWTKTVAWIPGLSVARHYPIHWLKDDIIAGIVLVTILVPVGIAYSVAAGLPPVYGLYATIIPLFAYALFGPSRIMVLGPDSALAAVIFAVVVPLSGGNPEKAVALAGVMAVAAGLTCLLAGLARLGFITDLLSKPIRYGYMNGIALVVIVSQLPVLFGFTVDGGGTPTRAWEFIQALLNGQTQFWSLLIGVLSLLLILLLRKQRHVSGILLAVLAATLFVGWQDLDRSGVAVLGLLPQGFPSFAFPVIPVSDLLQVAVGGVVAALLAVSETSVLSRAYATKTGDKVSANREMVGLGMANLATGFFQGFPISSSASRTPVAQAAGARSQLANVVGALLVLVLLVYAPELLRYLPDTVLAAVVIASMIGLMEIRSVGRIYRMRPAEFWLSLGCSAGIVVLGPIQGIGLAVLVALISFLWESWRPYSAVLVRVDNLKGYHDVSRYPHGRRIPGLVLFRWDAPLFFANAELFQERALAAVSSSPTPIRWLVVAAEPVTGVDVTAADMLLELDDRLASEGIDLVFAEMKDPVKDQMKQFGLFKKVGEAHFFPTIGQAVSSYLKTHNIPWVDWEQAQ